MRANVEPDLGIVGCMKSVSPLPSYSDRVKAHALQARIDNARAMLAAGPSFPGAIAGWKAEITRCTNRLAKMLAA